MQIFAFLGAYVSHDGKPPERRLAIDGDEARADRRVVEELRGEVLIANSLANRRRRKLMAHELSNPIDIPIEHVFEDLPCEG